LSSASLAIVQISLPSYLKNGFVNSIAMTSEKSFFNLSLADQEAILNIQDKFIKLPNLKEGFFNFYPSANNISKNLFVHRFLNKRNW